MKLATSRVPRVLTGLALAATASVLGVWPATQASAAAPPLPPDATALSTPFIDPRSADFVVARTTNNTIAYGRRDPTNPLISIRVFVQLAGATIQGDPVAANVPNGALVLARDTSNQVVTNFIANEVTPTGFTVLPGLLVSSDIEVVELPGANGDVLRIFARGLDDGAVYTNRLTTGGWTGWSNLGGFITSEISAALTPASGGTGIRIAVRGGDNRVFAATLFDDTIIGWFALGGPTVTGNIGLLQGTPNDPRGNEIFVQDSATRAILTANLDAPVFRNLGGTANSDITAMTLFDGSVEFFHRGTTNNLYVSRRRPGQTNFGGYANLGGNHQSNPAFGGNGFGDPCLVLFHRGTDQRLYFQAQRSNFAFTEYIRQGPFLFA